MKEYDAGTTIGLIVIAKIATWKWRSSYCISDDSVLLNIAAVSFCLFLMLFLSFIVIGKRIQGLK